MLPRFYQRQGLDPDPARVSKEESSEEEIEPDEECLCGIGRPTQENSQTRIELIKDIYNKVSLVCSLFSIE